MNWTAELISLTELKSIVLGACGWRECYFNWLAYVETELSIWYEHSLIKPSLLVFTKSQVFAKFEKNTIERMTATFPSTFFSHLVCVHCYLICGWQTFEITRLLLTVSVKEWLLEISSHPPCPFSWQQDRKVQGERSNEIYLPCTWHWNM